MKTSLKLYHFVTRNIFKQVESMWRKDNNGVILLAKDRRRIIELSTITGMTKVEGELFNIRNIYIPLFNIWMKESTPPPCKMRIHVVSLMLPLAITQWSCWECLWRGTYTLSNPPHMAQNVHVHHAPFP